MWIIKWIFNAIVILLVLGFALQNQSHTVTLTFIPGQYEAEFVPIWLVVYVSFASGVLFWLIVSIFQVLQLRSELRRVRRDNDRLRRELDDLRSSSMTGELAMPEVNSAKAPDELNMMPAKM